MTQDAGQQQVLAALHRVGLDTDQREQAGDSALDAITQDLTVTQGLRRRRRQGREDGDRQTGIAPRRVDAAARGLAQAPDALTILAPVGQTHAPEIGLYGRVIGHRHALAPCVIGLHPRLELLSAQAGKSEHQVAQIPLGVDGDGRNSIQRRLFQQRDAQSRFAAAGHAHAHRVGGQIGGVVQQGRFQGLSALEIVLSTQIEGSQLFEWLHARSSRAAAML